MKGTAIRALVVVLVLLVMTREGLAQQATSFEQLQVLVKPGDRVYVTDTSGKTSEGKIKALTTSSLSLTDKLGTRDLVQTDVFEIRKWRHDSLKNGLGIGTSIGLGWGLLAIVAGHTGSVYSRPTAGEDVGILLLSAGFGAGIGAGIDALIPAKQVVYRGENRSALGKFHFEPIISRSAKGAAISMKF